MNQKWELVRGNSNDVVDKIPDEIDFLFIDGDHTYKGVTDDYNNYGKKVREGGYIVFDNYDDPSWYQVKQAVDELYDESKYKKTTYGHCCVFEVLGSNQ
jgi:predicted O-methyltransferase YrrM